MPNPLAPDFDPPHPITITTHDNEGTSIDWSCPPDCHTPNTCPTIGALRNDAESHGIEDWPAGRYIVRWSPFGGLYAFHPDGSSVSRPVPESSPNEYVTSLFPVGDPAWAVYEVTTRHTPDGWGVFHSDRCLRWDAGAWDPNTITSGSVADFLTEHRHADLDDALAAAEKAAPDVTIDGVTAAQAWKSHDDDRRVREIFGSLLPARWRPRHTDAVLEVLALLTDRMSPEAARAWMLTDRYPTLHGLRNALLEISYGGGRKVIALAGAQAAPAATPV